MKKGLGDAFSIQLPKSNWRIYTLPYINQELKDEAVIRHEKFIS